MKLNREKVEMAMCQRKMSQSDIAKLLDVSTQAVNGYLRRCDKVMEKTIGKLADALQVEIDEIIE